MTQEELFKKLVAHCKEYGFVFPSSEIYDGLGAVYDYGQNGVELKNNIKRYWWDSMVKLHENIVGLDAAIFMHPKTWEASGHVAAFNDPLIDNRDSKKRYRADVLIEEWLAKQDEKIEKEVEKARKRFRSGLRRGEIPGHVAARGRDGCQTRRGAPPLCRGDECQRPGGAAADHPRLRDRLPDFGDAQLDRGAPVQPDVLDADGLDGRGCFDDLPASRDGAGHLRQLPERPEDGPHEAAVRYRADRQGLPQRDRGPSVHLPHARVRADGDAVLRPPGHRDGVVERVEEHADGLAPRPGLRRRQLPLPRPREAGPLRQRRHRHRVQLPVRLQGGRGHPLAHGFRPGQPPAPFGQEDCSISIRRRARATCPTWWRRRSASTACSCR